MTRKPDGSAPKPGVSLFWTCFWISDSVVIMAATLKLYYDVRAMIRQTRRL